jgi:catechol 2,3-dioxygenase-like lactoylglutathione lyase family enzyme
MRSAVAGELAATVGVSLQGRRFAAIRAEGGDVSAETVFDYGQDGDLIWARYSGGQIRLGHLAGTRHGDTLDFRYAHVTRSGETSSGHCSSTVVPLADGRLSLHEQWEWDSRTGSGESLLEEIPAPDVLGLGFAATATLRPEQTAEFFERVVGLTRGEVQGVEAELFVLPDGASFAVTSPRGIPGGRSIGFLVPDLDRASERLRASGVDVGPTYTNARERYLHFTAPDGETYELVERVSS